MTRFLALVLIIGGMAFNVSCSSKKKAEDTVAVGEVGDDANIGAKDMNFDPMGSDSGKIQGLATVHFDYDQAALTTSARQQLAENAEWIKSHGGITVQIEGHADSRGSVEYNLALGERRAKSVKEYLVGLGIDPKRLTIISYGKEKPVVQGDSEDAHSKNRRANFVPLPQ